MDDRHNNYKKCIRCLKNLITRKRIISATIIAIILFALALSIHNVVVDRNPDVLCISEIGRASAYHMSEDEGIAVGFLKGYLLTAWRFLHALWNSVRNVFQQIRTFFSMIFSIVWHPEKSFTGTLSAFMKGFWNSIRYLFRGSDTSIGTVLIKWMKIEKDGLTSLITNIIHSVIDLIHAIINRMNALFGALLSRKNT